MNFNISYKKQRLMKENTLLIKNYGDLTSKQVSKIAVFSGSKGKGLLQEKGREMCGALDLETT